MKYVAVYTHILVAKDDCDPQWTLELVYGTKDGHGCIIGKDFIPYSTFDAPTIVAKDVCSYEWETEVAPFNTLEEVLEDIHKKEAYYDMQSIEYMYSRDYFGLTSEEQARVTDFLYGELETQPVIKPTTEWIVSPDDIDVGLPFIS